MIPPIASHKTMSELRVFGVADARALLPYPDPNCNKYTRGGLAVIAGSAAYPGAAILAASAAPRAGAGYVRLVTPAAAAQVARQHLISVPVVEADAAAGVFCEQSVESTLDGCAKMRAALMGPGIGRAPETVAFVRSLLLQLDISVVIDADALFALDAGTPLSASAGCYAIITPHEGEAARLLGRKVQDREQDALLLARTLNCVCVLKGPDTLIANPEGTVRCVDIGGPELAKAGTGDVLAGMIGGLLAQGLAPMDASCLGVYLHSIAGQLCAQDLTAISVMPEDLLRYIGPAIRHVEK